MNINLKHGEKITVRHGTRVATIRATYDYGLAGIDVAFSRINCAALEPRHCDPNVARVNLAGQEYCYRNPNGATIGDLVRVVLPQGQAKYLKVVGLGRNGYTGNIYKACELVRESGLGA